MTLFHKRTQSVPDLVLPFKNVLYEIWLQLRRTLRVNNVYKYVNKSIRLGPLIAHELMDEQSKKKTIKIPTHLSNK